MLLAFVVVLFAGLTFMFLCVLHNQDKMLKTILDDHGRMERRLEVIEERLHELTSPNGSQCLSHSTSLSGSPSASPSGAPNGSQGSPGSQGSQGREGRKEPHTYSTQPTDHEVYGTLRTIHKQHQWQAVSPANFGQTAPAPVTHAPVPHQEPIQPEAALSFSGSATPKDNYDSYEHRASSSKPGMPVLKL